MNANESSIALDSIRVKKARLARRLGQTGYSLLMLCSAVLALGCIGLVIEHFRIGYVAGSAALICYALAVWYKRELAVLPPSGTDLTSHLSGTILGRLPRGTTLTPQNVWQAIGRHWQVLFMLNHLLLPSRTIAGEMSNDEVDMTHAWNQAAQLAQVDGQGLVQPVHLAAALMLTSPGVQQNLVRAKLTNDDIIEVASWLNRIDRNNRQDKPFFGGVGRDWASGFTPLLGRFGQNISEAIEQSGRRFDWLAGTNAVSAIENAFTQGANAIALIGETGIGKTSHVYALAQKLLEGNTVPRLKYNQIVSLNSSLILSSARGPGELEHIMVMLMQESLHAGHIIWFLDDALAFFGDGTGSFNAAQILLPVLQARRLRVILALTPHDYQWLKTKSQTFAALFTPIILTEPPERDVLHVLEDTSVGIEHQHNVVITYEAMREAYRLSGRYDTETAYPGRAIRLLEQSLSYANQGFVTETSVQRAIEQMRGVKVGAAAPAEADVLLHLEDKIHERMINQTRAVSVVANALRRARAGVANPKRPIGSFLFLGPTGVGKTELARSIAATYFGAETNMVRLDMSEYQQSEDVKRLLSDGSNEASSLILAVRQQPFSVVLLDEIEKAHSNILNLLLQLLDEGELTDIGGRSVSFKDCIIIATSNAGAQAIRERIAGGQKLEDFEDEFTDQLIGSGQFKPELLNRFDEIVLFRPLEPTELAQVVQLMMREVNATLANQKISVELTPAAIEKIVAQGYDARLGARPMRRALQRTVQDHIAAQILSGQTSTGDHVVLDAQDVSA